MNKKSFVNIIFTVVLLSTIAFSVVFFNRVKEEVVVENLHTDISTNIDNINKVYGLIKDIDNYAPTYKTNKNNIFIKKDIKQKNELKIWQYSENDNKNISIGCNWEVSNATTNLYFYIDINYYKNSENKPLTLKELNRTATLCMLKSKISTENIDDMETLENNFFKKINDFENLQIISYD
jgi:hypothetical protein